MRILMVNAYGYVTGGADRHCLALADALRTRGHNVAFLSAASESNVVTTGRFVPPLVTHANRDSLPLRRRAKVAGYALWNPDSARAMRELIDEFRPDVVHAHKVYIQLSVSPLVVAARHAVPIIQTLHDYELLAASALDDTGGWHDRDEARLSYRALNTATYPVRRLVHRQCVRAWISPSRFLAGRYAARGIRAHVLPHFVERSGDSPALAFSERRGAVFVGRLTSAKGVIDVLEVARHLPDTRVTVAGEGPLAAEVAAEARRLPNLEFVGFRDHNGVLRLLRSARIALMPSRWQEPAGLVALEAMSVGTPVLAYSSGGLAEYVSEAGAGQLVPGCAGALARACAALANDSRVWEGFSKAGLNAVDDTHAIERYTKRLENIYAMV